MAAIHDLLAQVQDEALRARLEQEINRLSKTKKFGLVFEEHLPECTPLYDIPVKRGSTVAKKTGAVSEMYEVSAIKDGVATCYHKVTEEKEEIPVEELVSVAQFGEPIYPYLKPLTAYVMLRKVACGIHLLKLTTIMRCSCWNTSTQERWIASISIHRITPVQKTGSITMIMLMVQMPIDIVNGCPLCRKG